MPRRDATLPGRNAGRRDVDMRELNDRVAAAAAAGVLVPEGDGAAIVPAGETAGKVILRRTVSVTVEDEGAAVRAILEAGPDSPLARLLKLDTKALRALATALGDVGLPGVTVAEKLEPSVRLS